MKIIWIPTFVGMTDPLGICHSCEACHLEKGEQENVIPAKAGIIKGYFQRKVKDKRNRFGLSTILKR
jgi:cytochrome c553